METQVMGLSELLKQMGDVTEDRDSGPPLDEVTAKEMLGHALAVLDERHQFRRGDVVRYKQGLESGVKGLRGGVGVFLEYRSDFNTTRKEPGWPMPNYDVDCVIGSITREGGMVEWAACSRYLEPAQ